MDNEKKERLEQELNFLKESLEADVISRDEYDRGKERIERKLKEIGEQKEEKPEIEEEKPIEKEPETEEKKPEEKEVIEEKPKEKPIEPKIEIKEIKEKPTRIIGTEEEKPIEEPKKEEIKEEVKEPEEKAEEPEEEIKISKKWLYGIAILIIAVILFFFIRSCTKSIEEEPIEEFIPECSSNSDCKKEGMIGICLNPATKEAKCEFKQDIKTNLILINDKNCSLCNPSTTKTIIKEIFPNVKIKEIDYETKEAKELINKLNINALPAYIFDSNVSKAVNFNDFSSALIKKENNYLITNTASGANYFFKRPLIKNKLELYILPETEEKIDSSMQEVLDLFNDKINFTKHVVTERQKEFLEKELAVNTYPTFLLNNQLKFRGILPANTIKENICTINYFEECETELSKI